MGKERVESFSGPIIYKTHVAYSRYFSEEYGFPLAFVDEQMPPYLDYFAVDVKYAGEFSSCTIRMLLDKEGPISLPEVDLYQPFSGGNLNMMRSALPKRNTDAKEKRYQWEFRTRKSDYDGRDGVPEAIHGTFALVGIDDPETPEGKSVSQSVDIETLKHGLFREWMFVELQTFCSPMLKAVFSRDHAYVLGNPTERKSGFTPSAKTFEESVQIPVPASVKSDVEADIAKIKFN